MNKTINPYTLIVMGFLSFILLTIVENTQYISQIFNSFNFDNFKEVLAGKEEEEEEEEKDEDLLEQKVCNKLFESETCEKIKEFKPIEKEEELTEEEIKAEAIINKYLEPVESEKKSTIDNNILNQSEEEQLSTQVNQSSVNSPTVSTNTQNLNNLNQVQLVDLISSTISNANNIDKNKIIQSLNDFIEPTKAKGGNVIESLKQLSEIILKEPSGSIANTIINLAKTK